MNDTSTTPETPELIAIFKLAAAIIAATARLISAEAAAAVWQLEPEAATEDEIFSEIHDAQCELDEAVLALKASMEATATNE